MKCRRGVQPQQCILQSLSGGEKNDYDYPENPKHGGSQPELKVSIPLANWMNYNRYPEWLTSNIPEGYDGAWGCDTTNPGMNDIGQGHVMSLVGPIRADKSEGKVRSLSCRLPCFFLLTGSSQPCQNCQAILVWGLLWTCGINCICVVS